MLRRGISPFSYRRPEKQAEETIDLSLSRLPCPYRGCPYRGSKRTEEEYVRWVTRLARQGGVACASLLGQEEVLAFLHDLQRNHDYEGSTVNQAVCALRLFFRDHLGRADWTCWAQIRGAIKYMSLYLRDLEPPQHPPPCYRPPS
jgi:hypothetical protein